MSGGDLQAWREWLACVPIGSARLAVLEQRPQSVASGEEAASGLLDAVVAGQGLLAHLQARQMADLAELSRVYPDGVEWLATELGLALSVAESTAQTYVHEATETMRRLPATFAVLDAGMISAVKVAVIRSGVEPLADEQVVAAVEWAVLRKAPTQTVPQLRESCARAVIRCDPRGVDARHRERTRQRRMRRRHLEDGMAGLWVESSAQDISTIWEACTALGQVSRIPGDDRNLDQLRVDALSDVCAHILDTGTWDGTRLPDQQGRRPHVQVVVPYEAFFGEPAGGDLAGYGPIGGAQAMDIAVDGTLQRLISDPLDNTLIDAGRTRYTPPENLRRFVLARDRTCVVPGCRQPAHRCEVDHVRPYRPGHSDGGRTDIDNLATLCRHHHRAKDAGRHHLGVDPITGSWTWTTPLGRAYPRPPTPQWDPDDWDNQPPGESRSQKPPKWDPHDDPVGTKSLRAGQLTGAGSPDPSNDPRPF